MTVQPLWATSRSTVLPMWLCGWLGRERERGEGSEAPNAHYISAKQGEKFMTIEIVHCKQVANGHRLNYLHLSPISPSPLLLLLISVNSKERLKIQGLLRCSHIAAAGIMCLHQLHLNKPTPSQPTPPLLTDPTETNSVSPSHRNRIS